MNRMRKYTSIGVAAGVLAGVALGFGLSVAGVSSAETPVVTNNPSALIAQETSEDHSETHPRREQMREFARERLRENLSPLVEEGVLSEEQLEAVINRLDQSRVERATQMRSGEMKTKIAEHRSQMRSERRGLGPMGPRR
jgi:hypothetical protein